MKLFSRLNTKIHKSNLNSVDYMGKILHLAPYKLSGHNVCASATSGCIKGCLNTAGHGAYNSVQTARINRTRLFFEFRETFMLLLRHEIKLFIKLCNRLDVIPAIRLNGTSDIMWENTGIIKEYPEVEFYDYTKHIKRYLKWLENPINNYHLTYSRSEKTPDDIVKRICELNGTVAVVFDKVPKTWLGINVVSGDETDFRFLDKKGVIIGLKAKGKAKKDDSGFVVRNA